MKQFKDEEIIYYKIKVRRVREVKGNKHDRIFTDKLWCIDCRDFAGHGFAFCEPTEKKAFKRLLEMLYLK